MIAIKECFEILPTAQQEIWTKLSMTKNHGFILYGGTAIALQLGHRESIDFDFFSADSYDKSAILKEFEETYIDSTHSDIDTLIFNYKGVKLSFFGNIDYVKYTEPLITSDDNIYIAPLEDLLATKLKVILERAEYKDYIDILTILNNGIKLEDGLGIAQAYFPKEFSIESSLKALTYFEDGDLDKMTLEQKLTLTTFIENIGEIPTYKLEDNSEESISKWDMDK